jgi:putative hemolysin
MDLSSSLGLLAVALLVLANGFFVATEFAIVAVRRSRLEQLAAEGSATAAAARQVVGHLDTYIAACQLGITMASLALGWLGEPAFAHLVEPPLEALIGQFAPAAAHGIAIGVAFGLITALHIVIGELAPKGLALQKPEGTTLFITRPILLFYAIFKLPIHALNAVGNGVLRLFGLEPASGHEMVHSVEELRLLVRGMEAAGTVEASEARIASRAFAFGDLTVGQLMTPRTEIDAVPVGTSLDELLARAREGTHSRLLVFEGTLDNVVGVLHLRDLFRAIGPSGTDFDLRRLVRSVMVTPASKPADELLDELRAARRHIALVLDEYGGTAGLVTLEDLVEALVGRIEEASLDEQARAAVAVDAPAPDESALVLDGLTRLEEFEELTRTLLPEDVHEQVDTLGGMVMVRLGRVPEVGDEVAIGDRALRVEAMDGRRVAALRLLPGGETLNGTSDGQSRT